MTKAGLPAPLLARAAAAARELLHAAANAVTGRVTVDGRPDRQALDREQHAVHGLAWYATYATLLEALVRWSERVVASEQARPIDDLLVRILVTEYAQQLLGGIPISQQEIVRPADLGVENASLSSYVAGGWVDELAGSVSPADRALAANLLLESRGRPTIETTGLGDELDLVRDEFRAFSEAKVVPHAHAWHLADALIPATLIAELSDLGVFGLTIPQRFGGAGFGKTAMCVVSEELSRGYIGVGSLVTRAEIAADLILSAGTQGQKDLWLPRIAAGTTLPTAAFTEPDFGSDLGSTRTRADRAEGCYRVTGSKSWTTHAARADLMMLLVRTVAATTDHRGLSVLLAPKSAGRPDCEFPDEGLSGSEIPVLGYRGMKEYVLAFDGFRVPVDGLLGGVEGQGFRQLLSTLESARIQTAARAIGVAQAALESGLDYATQRRQFGRLLYDYPRISNKILMTAAELLGVRQLTYLAARTKDSGKRCDLEAGMAKLLAARLAWAAADCAVQIHGGNGYALEFPVSRLLCDARVFSVFEGTSEIQAQVISRRLIDRRTNHDYADAN